MTSRAASEGGPLAAAAPTAEYAGSSVTGSIFHLALERDWSAAMRAGDYRISTLGRTLEEQGYIHASFAHQVAGVAASFYAAVTEPLVLLQLDATQLPVVLEPAVPGSPSGSAGAELFPHIYGAIPVAAVIGAEPYPVVA